MSLAADDAAGGVAAGRGAGLGAAGRGAAPGTKGGGDVTGALPVGGVNGDTGAVPVAGVNGGTGAVGAGRGVNGGTGGGDANSGRPLAGEGGVAVAVTGPLSVGRLVRGAAGTSAARGGCGAGLCMGGAAGVCRAGAENGGVSQPADAEGGVAGPDCLPRSAGVADGVGVRGAPVVGVAWPVGAGIVITPLQTEHLARTPAGGTFAGSTRKMERQSGQLTFIRSLQSGVHRG